jgi:hypothetical protein
LLELAHHILDMAQNAIEAGASEVKITIDEDYEKDRLVIVIEDNGRGLSPETLAKVLDPFYTTRKTRHVGLGLPLLAEACRRCEGDLEIDSTPGKGTRLTAGFRHSHIDRAPLGEMPTVLIALLLSEKPIDWVYRHRVNQEEFRLDTAEIKKELGEIPLTHPRVRHWLLETLVEGEQSLHPGQTGLDAPLKAGMGL